jgi:hypothetical protein
MIATRLRTACLISIVLMAFGRQVAANELLNPRYTVDGLTLVEGAQNIAAQADLRNVQPAADQSSVELVPDADAGTIVLAAMTPDFPFNEALPSWNGSAGPNSGFRVWMRAQVGRDWTPWFEAGTWGALADEPTTRVTVFAGGKYDADTLLLERPAARAQFRIDMVRAPGAQSPRIKLVALSYTNSTGNAGLYKRFGGVRPPASEVAESSRTPAMLNVPFHTQVVPEKSWINRICSPAAVSMAMTYFGADCSTEDAAKILYDKPADAFGVWHRSIQIAAQNGIRGYLTRLRTWVQVRAEIARGSVICASIRFKHGELAEPPRPYLTHGTEGHIIVVTGFASDGRVIVNNSGTKDWGHGQLWRQDDLAKAWFDKGGVAYVFTGRAAAPRAATPAQAKKQPARKRG